MVDEFLDRVEVLLKAGDTSSMLQAEGRLMESASVDKWLQYCRDHIPWNIAQTLVKSRSIRQEYLPALGPGSTKSEPCAVHDSEG